MPVMVRGEGGSVIRQDMPDYICDRMLDMLEERPLHEIKVKHLTDFCGISRNTFYTYFDSIYAVVQRIEDQYLEGFFPEAVARAVLVKGDASANVAHLLELDNDARAMRILSGPNGDAYFQERLGRRIRGICNKLWDESGSTYSSREREALCAYITGGTIHITRHMAAVGNRLTEEELRTVAERIIAANSILMNLG